MIDWEKGIEFLEQVRTKWFSIKWRIFFERMNEVVLYMHFRIFDIWSKRDIDLRERKKNEKSFLIVDILILYVYNRFDITGIRGWVVYVAV